MAETQPISGLELYEKLKAAENASNDNTVKESVSESKLPLGEQQVETPTDTPVQTKADAEELVTGFDVDKPVSRYEDKPEDDPKPEMLPAQQKSVEERLAEIPESYATRMMRDDEAYRKAFMEAQRRREVSRLPSNQQRVLQNAEERREKFEQEFGHILPEKDSGLKWGEAPKFRYVSEKELDDYNQEQRLRGEIIVPDIFERWNNRFNVLYDDIDALDRKNKSMMDEIYQRQKQLTKDRQEQAQFASRFADPMVRYTVPDIAAEEAHKSPDFAVMRVADRLNEETKRNIEVYQMQDRKNLAGLTFMGLKDGLFDAKTWTFGLGELIDQSVIQTIVEKDARGEALTASEENLVDAFAYNIAVNSEIAPQLSKAYSVVGKGTAHSLAFMLSIAATPTAGVGQKFAGIVAKKAMRKGLHKSIARLAGLGTRIARDAVIEAGTYGLTTGLGYTLSDTQRRMMGTPVLATEKDDEGDYHFDLNGFDQQEKFLPALAKGYGTSVISSYTELLSNYFVGSKALVRSGLNGIGLNNVSKWMRNVSKTGVPTAVREFRRWFNIGGLVEEPMEEFTENVLNALIIGDMTLDTKEVTGVFNKENLLDNVLGTLLLGGWGSTMSAIGHTYNAANANKVAINNLQVATDNLHKAFGAEANGIRQRIRQGYIDGNASQVILAESKGKSEAGRQAIKDYVVGYGQAFGTLSGIDTKRETSQRRGERHERKIGRERSKHIGRVEASAFESFDGAEGLQVWEDKKKEVDGYIDNGDIEGLLKKLREDELTDTGLTKEQQRLVNAYAAANIRHFMQQNADNAINVAEASVAWERNFLTENPELRAKINAMVENGELGKEHTVVGIVREIDESELAEEMKRETPSVEVEPEDGQEESEEDVVVKEQSQRRAENEGEVMGQAMLMTEEQLQKEADNVNTEREFWLRERKLVTNQDSGNVEYYKTTVNGVVSDAYLYKTIGEGNNKHFVFFYRDANGNLKQHTKSLSQFEMDKDQRIAVIPKEQFYRDNYIATLRAENQAEVNQANIAKAEQREQEQPIEERTIEQIASEELSPEDFEKSLPRHTSGAKKGQVDFGALTPSQLFRYTLQLSDEATAVQMAEETVAQRYDEMGKIEQGLGKKFGAERVESIAKIAALRQEVEEYEKLLKKYAPKKKAAPKAKTKKTDAAPAKQKRKTTPKERARQRERAQREIDRAETEQAASMVSTHYGKAIGLFDGRDSERADHYIRNVVANDIAGLDLPSLLDYRMQLEEVYDSIDDADKKSGTPNRRAYNKLLNLIDREIDKRTRTEERAAGEAEKAKPQTKDKTKETKQRERVEPQERRPAEKFSEAEMAAPIRLSEETKVEEEKETIDSGVLQEAPQEHKDKAESIFEELDEESDWENRRETYRNMFEWFKDLSVSELASVAKYFSDRYNDSRERYGDTDQSYLYRRLGRIATKYNNWNKARLNFIQSTMEDRGFRVEGYPSVYDLRAAMAHLLYSLDMDRFKRLYAASNPNVRISRDIKRTAENMRKIIDYSFKSAHNWRHILDLIGDKKITKKKAAPIVRKAAKFTKKKKAEVVDVAEKPAMQRVTQKAEPKKKETISAKPKAEPKKKETIPAKPKEVVEAVEETVPTEKAAPVRKSTMDVQKVVGNSIDKLETAINSGEIKLDDKVENENFNDPNTKTYKNAQRQYKRYSNESLELLKEEIQSRVDELQDKKRDKATRTKLRALDALGNIVEEILLERGDVAVEQTKPSKDGEIAHGEKSENKPKEKKKSWKGEKVVSGEVSTNIELAERQVLSEIAYGVPKMFDNPNSNFNKIKDEGKKQAIRQLIKDINDGKVTASEAIATLSENGLDNLAKSKQLIIDNALREERGVESFADGRSITSPQEYREAKAEREGLPLSEVERRNAIAQKMNDYAEQYAKENGISVPEAGRRLPDASRDNEAMPERKKRAETPARKAAREATKTINDRNAKMAQERDALAKELDGLRENLKNKEWAYSVGGIEVNKARERVRQIERRVEEIDNQRERDKIRKEQIRSKEKRHIGTRQQKATKKEIRRLADRLQKVLPKNLRQTVSVLSGDDFYAIYNKHTKNQYKQDILNGDKNVCGFFLQVGDKGYIYINADEAGFDTPIHEIGIHALLEAAKQNGYTKLQDAIIEFGKQAPEQWKQEVRDNYDYEEGSMEFYEEVAAYAMGDMFQNKQMEYAQRDLLQRLVDAFRDFIAWLKGEAYADVSVFDSINEMGEQEIGKALYDLVMGGKMLNATSNDATIREQSTRRHAEQSRDASGEYNRVTGGVGEIKFDMGKMPSESLDMTPAEWITALKKKKALDAELNKWLSKQNPTKLISDASIVQFAEDRLQLDHPDASKMNKDLYGFQTSIHSLIQYFASAVHNWRRKMDDAKKAIAKSRGMSVHEIGIGIFDGFEALYRAQNGRIDYAQRMFRKNFMMPLDKAYVDIIKEARQNGHEIDGKDVDLYRIALHAAERNRYICGESILAEMKKIKGLEDVTLDQVLQMYDEIIYGVARDASINDAYRNAFSTIFANNGYIDENNRIFSGMTDSDAKDIIDDFESKTPIDARMELDNAFRNATNEILSTALKHQLISQQTFDEYTNRYQYYVPLRDWDSEADREAALGEFGSVFDGTLSKLRPDLTKRAEGRRTIAAPPLATIQFLADNTIMSGETNTSRLQMYRFIHDNQQYAPEEFYTEADYEYMQNNPDLFKQNEDGSFRAILQPEWYRRKVEDGSIDRHGVRVFVNGQQRYVYLNGTHGELFSGAMERTRTINNRIRNMSKMKYKSVFDSNGRFFRNEDGRIESRPVERHPAELALTKAWAAWSGLTRYASMIRTSLSPVFQPINLMRDIPYAATQVYIEKGRKVMGTTLHELTNSLSELFSAALFGRYSDDYKKFLEHGGQITYAKRYGMQTIRHESLKRINRMMEGKRVREKSFTDSVADISAAFENVARFAAFKAALKHGASYSEAALLAHNASVDLQARGTQTLFSGSFSFFNSVVQAGLQQAQNWKHQPARTTKAHAMWYVLGMVGVLFQRGLIRALARVGGDDEETIKEAERYLWPSMETRPHDDEGILEYRDKGDAEDYRKKGLLAHDHSASRIPDYTKQNATAIITGVNEYGEPKGFVFFNLFHYRLMQYLASLTVDAITGRKDAGEVAKKFGEAAFAEYYPFSGMHLTADKGNDEKRPFYFLPIPTPAQPIARWNLNRNYLGQNIARVPTSDKSPEAIRPHFASSNRSTNKALVEFARWMNNVTLSKDKQTGIGAPDLGRGWIDISPEKLEDLLREYLGFAWDITDYVIDKATKSYPEELRYPSVDPFTRRFTFGHTDKAMYKIVEDLEEDIEAITAKHKLGKTPIGRYFDEMDSATRREMFTEDEIAKLNIYSKMQKDRAKLESAWNTALDLYYKEDSDEYAKDQAERLAVSALKGLREVHYTVAKAWDDYLQEKKGKEKKQKGDD